MSAGSSAYRANPGQDDLMDTVVSCHHAKRDKGTSTVVLIANHPASDHVDKPAAVPWWPSRAFRIVK
jgi:hypothetical protein